MYEAAACGGPRAGPTPALSQFLDGLPVELRFQPRDAARARRGVIAALAAARAPTCAQRAGGTAPPCRRGALARLVGGRRRGHGFPASARSKLWPVATEPSELPELDPSSVTRSQQWAERTRRPRIPAVCPLAEHAPRARAPRARDRGARVARRARPGARPLCRARPPQHRLRRRDPLEPALGGRPRGVAPVPDPGLDPRLLAGRPLRVAGAARRLRPGRLVARARRRDHARLRLGHELRLHDVGPDSDCLRDVCARDRRAARRVRVDDARAPAPVPRPAPRPARRRRRQPRGAAPDARLAGGG